MAIELWMGHYTYGDHDQEKPMQPKKPLVSAASPCMDDLRTNPNPFAWMQHRNCGGWKRGDDVEVMAVCRANQIIQTN